MTIGEKHAVRCCDGKTRTGRVIYIHPDNIFAVLEFTGVMGKWREYMPEEDKRILKSKNDTKLAKEIGVKVNVIWSHRALLKRRAQS